MSHEIEFAYMGVEVSNPEALDQMLTGMVGLLPGETTIQGLRTYRNDECSRRVFMQEGPLDDCSVLGFEASSTEAFENVATRLEDAGFELSEGDDVLSAERGVARIAYGESPWRLRFELVQGLEREPVPFFSPLVKGGFQTSGVGAGTRPWRSPRSKTPNGFFSMVSA